MAAVWNCVRAGKVLSTIETDSYAHAQAVAIARHGPGTHVSAEGNANTPDLPRREPARNVRRGNGTFGRDT